MIPLPHHLLLASFLPFALAHSHLEKLWANSNEYLAWDPNSETPSITPSWFTTNRAGNPLPPNALNTYDIICGKGSRAAKTAASIDAGSTLTVKWWQAGQPFPNTHWGPIVDYIAPCNGSCASVDPEDLEFVKIAEKGWIKPGIYPEGYWATSELVDRNGTWPIRIPEELAPGEYVVRHELIALHVAYEAIGKGPYAKVGAEFYPQCVSVLVGGSGGKMVTGGVPARDLYKGSEPGLAIDIHGTDEHSDYVIPGPAIWSAA
ncbi:lytic polysaccharide monooxygenase [Sporormia fimetaria CBS 119925]|uniref:Lytic polysaccharide monooxygenase n=1 Tax=Sporormia fimetaria CBS 119925 TaxID=1340428 RepID=A0A6A6VLR9_9PLEO|nr:lytic polysaccharide monooxygenase [Sporormia fimetaria CBS 119925]